MRDIDIALDTSVPRGERKQALDRIGTRGLNEIVADRRADDWVRKEAITKFKQHNDTRSLNEIAAATKYADWVRCHAIDCLGDLFDRRNLEAIASADKYSYRIRSKAREQLP